MENKVPVEVPAGSEPGAPTVEEAAQRSLAGRRATVVAEIERLVEASFRLVRRSGDLEPRVSEIVREAGLSNQAFYRHFRSKHELLVVVLDRGVAILAGYLEHRMGAVSSPREQVCEWIRGVLEQALDPEGADATRPFVQARGRLMERYPEPVARSEARLTSLLRGPLEEAVRTGAFPHADPTRDAEALYLLCMGWLQTRLGASEPARREDARALEAFALAGLAR